MTRVTGNEISGDGQERGGILLLGDDGRMEGLLRRGLGEVSVQIEEDVLAGIVRLADGGYSAVLVNAERTGNKTAEVVRAVRRAQAGVRVLLYGEGGAEVYAGAETEECLIWPIPVAELRGYLAKKQPKEADSIRVVTTESIESYRVLAALVPQGFAAVSARAEQVLPALLGVQWVRITPGDEKEQGRQRVAMRGPAGVVGTMEVGPSLAGGGPTSEMIEEVAGFLGTLGHLAERDASLKRLATTDELTGVYNRRYLESFVSGVIEQSQQTEHQVTLLLFDVDDLKHYNDTYGHAGGDEILSQAAELMRRCCREHDVVARIGGDEFAVVFWDTGEPRKQYEQPAANGEAGRADWSHEALTVFLGNRFRRMLKASNLSSLGPEARGVLTISGGMARFPQDGSNLTELLAKADEALLNAKRSGKDRIYLVGGNED